MLYDSLQYTAQVNGIAKSHRDEKDKVETSDEYLLGFYRTDKLLPVFTLTIYWGADEWTAPKDLHSMLTAEPGMLRFIDNYHLHLITPASISGRDFTKFHSELNAALKFIKYSNDNKELDRVLHDDVAYTDVSWETAEVISIMTGTDIPLNKTKKGRVDVCKAIEDMRNNAEKAGVIKTLVDLVKKGLLTLAQAAEQANMTVDEFEKISGLKA